MVATLPILEEIRQRILEKTTRFEVELFPDEPDEYRLNAEDGAILIQYLGSNFDKTEAASLIQQRRTLDLAITILARSQHNELGALNVLDQVRSAVMGFKPDQCSACYFVKEEWLGSESGIWQYQLIVRTYTHEVQHEEPQDLTKFVAMTLRYAKEK